MGAKKKIDGRRVIVSVSGGKDSTAMCLYLRELGIDFTPVFMDTGWEHPWLYKYIDDVVEPMFGPLVRLAPDRKMAELIRHKAMFPSRTVRFCTEFLKIFPFKQYLFDKIDCDFVNAVGIRAAESKARRDLPEWEEDVNLGCEVWRPLIAWTFEDVRAIHEKHGVIPCRLYLEGATRVGCFPCIYARKKEIALVDKFWPERIDEIRLLESELSAAVVERAKDPDVLSLLTAKAIDRLAFARLKADGGAPGWKDWGRGLATKNQRFSHLLHARALADDEIATEVTRMQNRTFFHNMNGFEDAGIDTIVEWAKTARGGRQFELFDPAENEGCMRWALCDFDYGDES